MNAPPSDIKSLIPKRWNWKEQAERVEMKDEYEFIYAYASRLLHATPAVLTPDFDCTPFVEAAIDAGN